MRSSFVCGAIVVTAAFLSCAGLVLACDPPPNTPPSALPPPPSAHPSPDPPPAIPPMLGAVDAAAAADAADAMPAGPAPLTAPDDLAPPGKR